MAEATKRLGPDDPSRSYVTKSGFTKTTQGTTDAERARAMLAAFGGLQGIMNSGMSGKQLLEGLSGAAWNSSVADGKSAADLINGYKNGTLAQSAGAIAGYKPVSNVSGGTVNDMNQATGA